jgi:undecaprenyl phosphate N,N'-diacetylbacillosamine 1-phosphate transferase
LKRRVAFVAKRFFDFAVAGGLLVILIPAFAIIALAISFDSRGPIFFKLRVAGRRGRGFNQWKFRTMVTNARQMAHAFETFAGDPRITKTGRFLRRWSLDELPQLWNVLRGEMSLVGPRPAFAEIAARYSPYEARRLDIRPGITGLAQIHGRNLIPWPRRVEFDLDYIDRFSIWLDARILLRTIPLLLKGEGIYGEDGGVRMHRLA